MKTIEKQMKNYEKLMKKYETPMKNSEKLMRNQEKTMKHYAKLWTLSIEEKNKNKQQIMKTVCRMIVVPPATMHERLIVFCGSRAW